MNERDFGQKNLVNQAEDGPVRPLRPPSGATIQPPAENNAPPSVVTAYLRGDAPGSFGPAPETSAPYSPNTPTIEVQLPSGTSLYKDNVPGGLIKLKALEQREVDILGTDHLIKRNKAFEKAFDSCIISPRISSNMFITGDKVYLIFKLFEISKGTSVYTFDQTCPNCKNRNKITIDLNELPVKMLDIQENSFTTDPLPISKRRVKFHLLTGFERNTVEDKIRTIMQSTSAAKLIDSTSTEVLLASVDEIEGLEPRHKTEFIRHMVLADGLELRKKMNSCTPGINPVYRFSCVHCPYDEELLIPITAAFFENSSKD